MPGDAPSEREALERRVVERALADTDFRARLLADPRGAVSEVLGFEVPASLEIEVVEERPDRLAIVLPVDLGGMGSDAVWAMTGVPPSRPVPPHAA